ncbi:MAG: hypothetical protein NC038_06360 [Paludibacter sp.]|nr:hypothetical protein [Bacteroidales bacterium]MCM1069512.1 hypothetical protein [Prevotella sp.]MCM1354168.1 hypothetical protein [Bacteroides sp.]MCM1442975.1 hypothetical protein [Muribaculum sp.]MCM1482243.1 hypothetical protein [Paludibacter sp.]
MSQTEFPQTACKITQNYSVLQVFQEDSRQDVVKGGGTETVEVLTCGPSS